jgi:hypothetical protein
MNERIQALAEQAEQYASEKDGKYDGTGNLNWQWQDIKMEKFAELIVRECIEQVVTGPNGPAHYAVEAALRLKKHFGVEE